jgi:hypothetical protein
MSKSTVYFTSDISPDGLVKVFDALNRNMAPKVAIKISTGELGGHNYLKPELISKLVNKLDGTIVECNTAYNGKRCTNEDHIKVIEEHGFNIFPYDIMDSEGEMRLPINGGKHLKGYNIVGSHISNYNSMLMLSHFKGHAMGGFGGALKNMSIGVASRNGKSWIHTAGFTSNPFELWNHVDDQDAFLESMAEACKSVIDYFGDDSMAYINVANNISIDCDCAENPSKPEISDIGIFASLDPVALDQCCYDTIMNLSDEHALPLKTRMLEKHAIHIVEEASILGLGNRDYELINIDNKS